MTLKVKGKAVHAKELTADEWFDAVDLPSKREQDAALISVSIVDKGGNAVLKPEEARQLGIKKWAELYTAVLEANIPSKPEKK